MEELLVDKKDLKVKHATGQYLNLPSAPEPDDIIYYMISKKKYMLGIQDLINVSGESKSEMVKNSVDWLVYEGHLMKEEIEQSEEILYRLITHGQQPS